MNWEILASIIGVGLTVIFTAVRTTRQLSLVEINLREMLSTKMMSVRKEFDEDIDRMKRDFGESVKGALEHSNIAHGKVDNNIIKIQQVELYIRDNYIETTTFNIALARLEKEMERINAKLDILTRPSDGERIPRSR